MAVVLGMKLKKLEHDAIALRATEKGRARLEQLYEVAVPRLRGTIIAKLGALSVTHAADVSQEVFLAFARREMRGDLACLHNRRIADIDDEEFDRCIEECCVYLFRIAEHKCAEFHRKSNLYFRLVGQCGEKAPRCEADPTVDLIRQEQINRMQQAVTKLPEQCRQVVVQYFYERCTEKEIGAALNISARTVRRYLQKGLEQLRKDIISANDLEKKQCQGH